MRYLIKFTKEKDIKFVSHLELMRAIHRIIRRSGIPVEYSHGFNPHIQMSIAQPLSVGMHSVGDYLDLNLTEEVNEEELINKLNCSSTKDIKFLGAVLIKNKENSKKAPQAMAAIDAANYRIRIKYENTDGLESELKELLDRKEWIMEKKSKKGIKEVDIKKLVKDFNYKMGKSMITIDALISCGSRENLSPKLLSEFIQENTSSVIEDSFVDIYRKEIYAFNNRGKLLPLDSFFKGL